MLRLMASSIGGMNRWCDWCKVSHSSHPPTTDENEFRRRHHTTNGIRGNLPPKDEGAPQAASGAADGSKFLGRSSVPPTGTVGAFPPFEKIALQAAASATKENAGNIPALGAGSLSIAESQHLLGVPFSTLPIHG